MTETDLGFRGKGSGKVVKEPFYYSWRHLPIGSKRPALSRVDALIEVLMHELRVTKKQLFFELYWSHAQVSRIRHHGANVPEEWLLNAALYSGIPYRMLCTLINQVPRVMPHPNAWKGKE